MSKVLVVYYSQSGQAKSIADSIVSPMIEQGIAVDFCRVEMAREYPFPWNREAFFDVFPETFLQIPQAVRPIDADILNTEYDLIILAYQAWYLSPSLPMTSFLQSDEGRRIVEGRPVVTVSGNRNMWAMAQKKIDTLLIELGAVPVGNIALSDRHNNHISVLTIMDWMMSGVRRHKWGILPLPGVARSEIEQASVFGNIIAEYLACGSYDGMQARIVAQHGADISALLVSTDRKANRIFRLWANLCVASPRRGFWIKAFEVYLYVAIWLLLPIVSVLYAVTYPLLWSRRKKYKTEVQMNYPSYRQQYKKTLNAESK